MPADFAAAPLRLTAGVAAVITGGFYGRRFAVGALGVGLGYGLYGGYYDDYYDYPYYGYGDAYYGYGDFDYGYGYGGNPYYGYGAGYAGVYDQAQAACAVVKKRVHTANGWRVRRVQVCS